MHLSDYPCESLTFTGLGASGSGPQEAAAALAEALNGWAAAHTGQRLLQITPLRVHDRVGTGLAVLLVHTAGPDLTGELADQVAAAIEDASETIIEVELPAELSDPVRRGAV
jgi:hypothetical protein